jgi:hypothetical protein
MTMIIYSATTESKLLLERLLQLQAVDADRRMASALQIDSYRNMDDGRHCRPAIKRRSGMLANHIFIIDMLLGYLASGLCLAVYIWPRLRAMDRVKAHRAIATFNSFRFFGLVFLLPGFVGPNLPAGFAVPAAYADLATALLAILALLAVRVRFLFWPLVWAFNLVGLADLVLDTAHAVSLNVPSIAGQLGASYAIVMLYVPALFLMHLFALWLLLRPAASPASPVRPAAAPMSVAVAE